MFLKLNQSDAVKERCLQSFLGEKKKNSVLRNITQEFTKAQEYGQNFSRSERA